MSDLFPSLPVSLSPFAKWKASCGVYTYEEDVLGNLLWVAVRWQDSGTLARRFFGESEEEACIKLARKLGIPWIHGEKL